MKIINGFQLVFVVALATLLSIFNVANAQPWSQKMAATAMRVWPDTGAKVKWEYDEGVVLKGIEGVWLQTGENQYFKHLQTYVDALVAADGTIKGYKQEDYNIDNVLLGRAVLTLYQVLGSEKYYKALQTLREQLKNQPRTNEGGFWHKKRYPNQMWLDGLYMGEPFYAEYAAVFHEDADFDDIANQFIYMENHARDANTGLLYHGWDESKKEKWSDPKTGNSQNFWGRSVGWYAMGLVDVLDKMPANHPKREALLGILNRLAVAIQKYQDAPTGLWYQVLDKGTEKGNYLESSASCMFVYALAKGARQGYIPISFKQVAEKGYQGIISKFIETDTNGQVNLNGTVKVSGLGGTPYRDGSYQYYLSEKVIKNDAKGVGAFIQAAVEMERLTNLPASKGKIVLLDSYFNDEHKIDKTTGKTISYHYKWDELDNDGYSLLGHIFNNYGLSTTTLFEAPTAENLKKASVYIITDPDVPKENPTTKYIEEKQAIAIANWVKAGGVLLVFNNDIGNAEFKNLNVLMAKFGMQFNEDSRNHVKTPNFETGGIEIPADNVIFKTTRKVYLKEISTLKVTAPAISVLTDKNDVIIATAKYGKGTVFAVGDPWFYNEYTDGRKLPADYENFKGANDLVNWVTKQLKK